MRLTICAGPATTGKTSVLRHMIRKLLVKENRVVRVAGTGTRGMAGVGGPPRDVQLNQPHGVFVDPQGILYIVDSGNDRVLKLTRP